jgi:hypothetical protein
MNLPDVLNGIIAEYTQEHKLLPWINKKKLDWRTLSSNKNAIELLRGT